MIKLEDISWKTFKVEDLFDVKGSKTTPKSELKSKKKELKKYPYVTTKSGDNGIEGFYNFYTEKSNVITVDSATDGNIFYQFAPFSASDHVEILTAKFKMNKYIGLFIVNILTHSINKKYNYGYKCSQKRIRKQKIKLPINSKSKPDFKFMETYTKEKEKMLINTYKNYLDNKKLLIHDKNEKKKRIFRKKE